MFTVLEPPSGGNVGAAGGTGNSPTNSGVDMNPYDFAGNGTSIAVGAAENCLDDLDNDGDTVINDGCGLGGTTGTAAVTRCVEKNVGDYFRIDTFIDDVPNAVASVHDGTLGSMGGSLLFNNAKLDYKPAGGTFPLGFKHDFLHAVITTGYASNSAADTGTSVSITLVDGGGGPPFAEPSGSYGTMGRYEFKVIGGADSLTFMRLTGAAPDYWGIGDGGTVGAVVHRLNDIPTPDDTLNVDDEGDGIKDDDPIYDAADGDLTAVYGIVAIGPNVKCPPAVDIKIVSFLPVGAPTTLPVDTQTWIEFTKEIHNNGPVTADILVSKEADAPDNLVPAFPDRNEVSVHALQGTGERGTQCANNTDDEDNDPFTVGVQMDGWVNDGCPQVLTLAETGALCADNVDANEEGSPDAINDGCPAQGTLITVKNGVTWGFKDASGVKYPPAQPPANCQPLPPGGYPTSPATSDLKFVVPLSCRVYAESVQGMDKELDEHFILTDVPVSMPAPFAEEFDVDCLEASNHTWTFQNHVAPYYPYTTEDTDEPEFTPGNNGVTDNLAFDTNNANDNASKAVTIACTANADLKVTQTAVTLTGGFADITGDTVADPPYITPGMSSGLAVTITASNLGPYGPTAANVTGGAATQAPYTPANLCTIVGGGWSNQVSVGPDAVLTKAFTISCNKNTGGTAAHKGIERDDDADTEIDEDRAGGPGRSDDKDVAIDEDKCDWAVGGAPIDNDGDTLANEDDPAGNDDCDVTGLEDDGAGNSGPCNNGVDDDFDTNIDLADSQCLSKIDEDSPIVPIIVGVSNGITKKDPHVTDAPLTNNSSSSSNQTTPLLLVRNFALAGTTPDVFGDDTNAIGADINGEMCMAQVGLNGDCETVDVYSPGGDDIAMDDECIVGAPCKQVTTVDIPGNQPLGLFLVKEGSAFAYTSGMALTNGNTVGAITFKVGTDMLSSHLCTGLTPAQGVAILYDAKLPFATEGAPADTESVAPATDPNIFSTTVWSKNIEDDLLYRGVAALGLPVWARYVGTIPMLGEPVNIIVFTTGVSWVIVAVIGDPHAPFGGINTCTPEFAQLLINGTTKENTSQVVKTCTAAGTHVIEIDIARADTGGTFVFYDTVKCQEAEEDLDIHLAKDEDIGDDHPHATPHPSPAPRPYPNTTVDDMVPVSIPVQYEVDITLTSDKTGLRDYKVALSIVSTDPCTAEWVGQTGDTEFTLMQVGVKNIDRLEFTVLDQASGYVASRNYSIHCTQAGAYPQNIQITATVSSPTGVLDPVMGNNTAENHVDVTATNFPDVDGDTDPNVADNCLWVYNPDQLDSDGDGMGDACDDDDDNDTIPDATDQCDTAAEDWDGESNTDGCPDSDARNLTVSKDDRYPVDVSENHRETVTARIQNGNYTLLAPNGMEFRELLKTLLEANDTNGVLNPAADRCEARWVAQTGDNYVEDVVLDDWDGDTQLDDWILMSQLEVVVQDVEPNDYATKVREYEVHCTAPSTHTNVIFLEESAIPTYPVIDPNVMNGNVEKQWITIDVSALADVKKLSIAVFADDCTSPPPTSITAGTNVDLCIQQTLHNNGPFGPVTISDVLDATQVGASDCTILNSHQVFGDSLPVSVDRNYYKTVRINCTNPSFHTLRFADTVSVDQVHVRDPNSANNSKSRDLTLAVTDTADVTVDVVVDEPGTIPVSQNETFDVTKTISASGVNVAVDPLITQALKPIGLNKADCSVSFHVTNALLDKVLNRQVVIKKALDANGDTVPDPGSIVVINPPTPAGWEASDRVYSDYGGVIIVEYRVVLPVGVTVVVNEEWDKHCTKPSFHDFQLKTDVAEDTEPHVTINIPQLAPETWEEAITAEADLKIVDWFFLDIPKWDSTGDTTPDQYYVELQPSTWKYGHEKQVLHNNGPYGPAPVEKIVTAEALGPSGCGVSYNYTGLETALTFDGVPFDPASPPTGVVAVPPQGGVVGDPGTDYRVDWPHGLDVHFHLDLPVSSDVWEAELWNFHLTAADNQCTVRFTKTLEGTDQHIDDANGATATKNVLLCKDTDGDGISDNCMGEQDNCPTVPNANQLDSDGDGLGDACDSTPIHDDGVERCLVFGPAPANNSDTQGRYMWVICQIKNLTTHNDLVDLALTVEAPPSGCTVTKELILPGQFDDLPLAANELKWVLYRLRYECHNAANTDYPLDIAMCVDHQVVPSGSGDDNLHPYSDNNCWNGVRTLIVHTP